MQTQLPVNAVDLLPHKGRMCCIDRLVEENDEYAVAEVTLGDGHALVTNGVLDRAGMIELAAQTAGARHGFAARRAGRDSGPGFLAGAQDFVFLSDARAGDTLTITVRLVGEFMGMSVVSASIACNGAEIASGKLKVFTPPTAGSVGKDDAGSPLVFGAEGAH